MKQNFLQWHAKNGGDISTTDGNLQDNPKEVRKANPELKRHNHIFANQIEVIDAEIVVKYKIGQEVAFDMNCPCGGDCGEEEQGYLLHKINGKETDDFLNRCYVFSNETMNSLR